MPPRKGWVMPPEQRAKIGAAMRGKAKSAAHRAALSCSLRGNVPWNKGRREAVAARFWAKVDQTSTCWIWTGSVNGDHGYGKFWWEGRWWRASRVAWVLARGPIPAGLLVLHHCDNPACVRPDHLFLGTQSDNMRDCVQKGRHRWSSFM